MGTSDKGLVAAYLESKDGERLVEQCMNECINGIGEGIEEFENYTPIPKMLDPARLSGLFENRLTSRVIDALRHWNNEQATENELRGGKEED